VKAKDADILILPGRAGGGAGYWYSRWAERLQSAKEVKQADWHNPEKDIWIKTLDQAIQQSTKPVILIAHSFGALTAVHHANGMDATKVSGAFLVAPPDLEVDHPDLNKTESFGPVPRNPLPYPSIVVASSNDPFSSIEKAADQASAWGSLFIDAGEAGHLNEDSGHGPWPEGLMVFAKFISRL
jgi:predicted alpha/beta hydrolase family esterase